MLLYEFLGLLNVISICFSKLNKVFTFHNVWVSFSQLMVLTEKRQNFLQNQHFCSRSTTQKPFISIQPAGFRLNMDIICVFIFLCVVLVIETMSSHRATSADFFFLRNRTKCRDSTHTAVLLRPRVQRWRACAILSARTLP